MPACKGKEETSLHHGYSWVTDISNRVYIFLLAFFSKINESWEKKKIKQRCKLDCVEVGDNWKTFFWPNKPDKNNKIKRISSIFEDQPAEV